MRGRAQSDYLPASPLRTVRAPFSATFADPLRAQSAVDRFTSYAYDLLIEGESYRRRLEPTLARDTASDGTESGQMQ